MISDVSSLQEAILAIASSMTESEFTTSVCQGIHATLQNVVSTNWTRVNSHIAISFH